MARQHHYRRRSKEIAELDVTTFLNLMVVLVPFLLITAVFSRIAIVELHLPSANSSTQEKQPPFSLEVIVRQNGLELTNGHDVIAAIPNVESGYDLDTLGNYILSLKKEYPESNAASVLLEPDIAYDYLIQVMDVVRSADVPAEVEGEELQQLELFTEISIGEAP